MAGSALLCRIGIFEKFRREFPHVERTAAPRATGVRGLRITHNSYRRSSGDQPLDQRASRIGRTERLQIARDMREDLVIVPWIFRFFRHLHRDGIGHHPARHSHLYRYAKKSSIGISRVFRDFEPGRC